MQSPVLLAQPVFNHVLSWFFGALLIAAGLFATFTHYAQHETVQGEVSAVSGFSPVTVEQAGIVRNIAVRQGDPVRKGMTLAVLELPPIVASDGDTRAFTIARMEASLNSVDQQIAQYRRAITEAQDQIAAVRQTTAASLSSARERKRLTRERRDLASRRLQGYEDLAAKGYVPAVTVDEVRGRQLQLDQEASDTDLAMDDLSRVAVDRTTALEARIRDAEQAIMALKVERLQAENQLQERRAMQSVQIVAPADGEISAVSVREGQRVEIGQRLLAVGESKAKLTALLQVPSRAIGMIEPGQRVVIKYDAFPYQTFGVRYGRVIRVERASLETGTPVDAEAKAITRHFTVEVQPDDRAILAYGERRPLRIGMTLTADIEVQRRSLIGWFLEPLYALRGRVA